LESILRWVAHNQMRVYMKKDNENAKDKRWIAPVKLPGAKPEDYDASIESANGSANYLEAEAEASNKKSGKTKERNREE
jgi:hypothetical protein